MSGQAPELVCLALIALQEGFRALPLSFVVLAQNGRLVARLHRPAVRVRGKHTAACRLGKLESVYGGHLDSDTID